MAQKGEHLSEETKKKLSLALKGRSVWNKGLRGRQKAWNKGISTKLLKVDCICGKEFEEYASDIKVGNGKYCSRDCYNKYHEVWNKGKEWHEMRGENSPHWKGGKSPARTLEMGRLEYKLWRIAVYTRDNYTCKICGIKGGRLNADHIKPWAIYPELRYAIDNGRTLCVSCHKQTDTFGLKTYFLERRLENERS